MFDTWYSQYSKIISQKGNDVSVQGQQNGIQCTSFPVNECDFVMHLNDKDTLNNNIPYLLLGKLVKLSHSAGLPGVSKTVYKKKETVSQNVII